MPQHGYTVRRQTTIRLDVGHACGVRRRERSDRVFDHIGGVRQHETPMRKDARSRFALEKGVRHGCVSRPPLNPFPKVFSASVSSLGMIQSLEEALSLIFGRVCRY